MSSFDLDLSKLVYLKSFNCLRNCFCFEVVFSVLSVFFFNLDILEFPDLTLRFLEIFPFQSGQGRSVSVQSGRVRSVPVRSSQGSSPVRADLCRSSPVCAGLCRSSSVRSVPV